MNEAPPDAQLTNKQQAFVEEYLVDLNATQAAIRAGYSEHTAKDIGCENLAKPNIQDAIQILMDERSKRTAITADKVLQEIAKLGFSNMQDYMRIDDQGLASIDLTMLTREQAAAITEITVSTRKDKTGDEDTSEVENVKLKLADKGVNLERLGKHLKLFTDRQELTGSNGGPLNHKWTVEIKNADHADP